MCECTCTSCLGTGCSAHPPPPTLSLVNPNWLDGAFSHLFISSPGSSDNQCVSLGKSLTLPCLILPLWKEGGHSGPTYSKELSRGALWQWGPQRTTFGFRCAFSLPEFQGEMVSRLFNVTMFDSCRPPGAGWVGATPGYKWRD